MKNENEVLIDFISNPEAIKAIFKDEPICLKNIRVAKYLIDCIEDSVTISFDLENFLKNPPKKWILQKFNTVRVILKIFDIKDVNCNYKFHYDEPAEILLKKEEDIISLSIIKANDILFFKVRGKWLYMDKIEAYTIE